MVIIICQEFLMNGKSLLKIFISMFCVLFFSTLTYANPVNESAAVSWVNVTGHKLIDALSSSDILSKYETLDKMFKQDVDTEHMARFVIGKYWKTMDSSQQQHYMELFSRYALSVYKNYPLDFDTKGLDFEVLSVKQNQKFTDVTCSVMLPEQFASENLKSINVKFKLTQNNQKIKIVDLIFGQSSLLSTYRSRFYAMVTDLDEDMGWFLEDFADLVVSSEKTAQEKADNY
ncbi:MAG: ABC transporter substrate-binding protein [Alphaproteobacteria bacterium]|nr:ABC transporter substrate-binding protein [Alphaproteobacteria bacterium]